MRRWLKMATVGAGTVAVGTAAVARVAGARWDRATSAMLDRLTATSDEVGATSTTLTPDELSGLPAPVARYFEFALTAGQPLFRRAWLRWDGTFRLAPDSDWKRFTAQQHVTVRPPGFVWDATIHLMPVIPARVRDVYIGGEGAMLGKVAALVPVVDERGSPELAAGALSRYLGEAVWVPTALLPSAGVSWTPVNDSTARATLTDGPTSVSAEFSFGDSGEIVATSMTRYRDVKGHGVPTLFEARLSSGFRRISGMMVPVEGEAAWVLPEGRSAYWRGRLAETRYER